MGYEGGSTGLLVEQRKMRGEEIITIAKARNEKCFIEGVTSVLRAVTVAVIDPGPYSFTTSANFDWGLVHAGDVVAALFQQHTLLHGEVVKVSMVCQRCTPRFEWVSEVKLSELTVKPLPEASLAALRAKRALEATTLNGVAIKFLLPTGAREKYLRDQHRQMRHRPEWRAHISTHLDRMAAQITYIDGLVSSRGEDVSNQFTKRLEWLIAQEGDTIDDLLQQMNDADGGIDTAVVSYCPNCGTEHVDDLPLDRLLQGGPERSRRPPTEKTPQSSTTVVSPTPSAALPPDPSDQAG